jgi:hypothetical protein
MIMAEMALTRREQCYNPRSYGITVLNHFKETGASFFPRSRLIVLFVASRRVGGGATLLSLSTPLFLCALPLSRPSQMSHCANCIQIQILCRTVDSDRFPGSVSWHGIVGGDAVPTLAATLPTRSRLNIFSPFVTPTRAVGPGWPDSGPKTVLSPWRSIIRFNWKVTRHFFFVCYVYGGVSACVTSIMRRP